MRHPEFPIVSFISTALVLICLPSHIRARSVSTLALIAWLGITNIVKGINSIIWANNVVIRDRVWCDISTKIIVGFTFAVPAAAMCILRHLEHIASARHVMTTRDDKRRRQIFEAIMCFGIPVLFMTLHYVVQGHRYDLFEDIGCMPTIYFSWAGLFLIYVPPLILSTFSLIFAVISLHHFLRHRINFATHLRNSQSTMSPNRFFRLMALSIVTVCWDTSINSWIIWGNVTLGGFRPWVSWENVHSDFFRVQQLPTFLIPESDLKIFVFQWWLLPVSAILFFIFFGFGGEAMSDYNKAIIWFCRAVIRQNINNSPTYKSTSSLPMYIPHTTNVNLGLSPKSGDDLDQKAMDWDAMSLKMPDLREYVSSRNESGISSANLELAPQTVHRASRVVEPASVAVATAQVGASNTVTLQN